MNKHLHRVVFNAARGLRVVVQETARSVGKATGTAPAIAAGALFGVLVALPGQAQIVGAPGVAPGLRPTVLVAPNGVPLVNIQTPSAAGVSRNLYHQFDVQSRGVILNNSRSNVQTQLGGWVQANPYLATGPARIILNEIVSGNPTQLRGAIEVGGQRAEVIVANPAGIAVDGGTFVNASRATLTTGTPQLDAAGGLDGYVVRGGTVTLGGANVSITATGPAGQGGDLHIAGTTVHTPGMLSLNAGTLHLDTQSTVATLETGSQRKDFAWQQQRSRGSSDETSHYNQFHAGALAVNAQRVQAGLGARDSLDQLARQPGMEWIEQLNDDPQLSGKIDWVRVEEAHKNWDYKQQGLTPEGAAIVTLVVSYFTAGTASGLGASAGAAVGGSAGTVVGGAVTAGVTALASQASVALINNRGDIGAALNDLGSSASVKSLLTAIVTGGVLAGLNLDPTGLPTQGGGAQPLVTQLGQNLTAGVARAVIGTAINGGSFEENLREGIKGALLDTVAAQGANAIGDLTADGALDGFANTVAHAIAGCMVGAARADSASGCGAGALGAAIGELAAEAYGRRDDTVQFAALVSGLAVAVTGGDASQINIGSQAGGNAAANNFLTHEEASRLRYLNYPCKGSVCTEEEIDEWQLLKAKDLQTTAALNSCAADFSDRCKTIREDFRAAAATYLPTRGEVLVWSANKADESGGRLSVAEIYEAYSANVFGVPPTLTTGDLNAAADWVRSEIIKEPPLSRIAMGLATYQNAEWAHYFGANVAANLMAQARSMARPEPLTDKRPPTVVRNGELLDSEGNLIGIQNSVTGQWMPPVLALPRPGSATSSAVFRDEAATGGAIAGTATANSTVKIAGELTGTPTRIPNRADASQRRSLTRENESARILANHGFKVEQNPTVPGSKNPDYRINGEVFDNYAPVSNYARNIASNIEGKIISEQTRNVVVNLADSHVTPTALQEQLAKHPISGLEQVIIVDRSGKLTFIRMTGK